tara:strand:+ start:1404 stop:2261 length:858 start_codon:yes stop_codon:yes gene_type:complete
MRKIILVFLYLYSNTISAQSIKIDTNYILIGEQTKLVISSPITKTSLWPVYSDTLIDGIEIIKLGEIDTVNNLISQEIYITAWDSGTFYIPPINFSKNNESNDLILNVKTIILEENATLKDIKEPIKEPIGIHDVWKWLIIIILIFGIILLIKKHLFKEKEIQEKKIITKKIAIDIIAINALNELEKKQLCQEGKVKEYYSSISEIIRRYIGERFNFIALELTKYEILDNLHNKVNKIQLTNIDKLLHRADLVKYAKNQPSSEENIESINIAKKIIETTKENSNV